MAKDYDSPEVTEYGSISDITEGSGTNKVGDETDEESRGTPLTGSIGFGSKTSRIATENPLQIFYLIAQSYLNDFSSI